MTEGDGKGRRESAQAVHLLDEASGLPHPLALVPFLSLLSLLSLIPLGT